MGKKLVDGLLYGVDRKAIKQMKSDARKLKAKITNSGDKETFKKMEQGMVHTQVTPGEWKTKEK